MIGLCIVFIITATEAASVLFRGDPLVIESCTEGVTITNDCNTCVCSQNHVFECSSNHSVECKDNTQNRSQCQPNNVYVLNDTVCVCNGSGQWPHDNCKKTFQSLGSAVHLINCKPNSYVRYDCNVCRCGSDGKVKKDRCTKNKCNNSKGTNYFTKNRRTSTQNNVYGNCEVKNWYSLAPCQFCFCVNENRLVCNTGNSYSHKLELGSYNLSVCGKELIREAIELIPEHEKALRYGMNNKVTESANPGAAVAKEIALHDDNVAINVNHDGSNLKFETTNKQNEYEYYTDSEEEKPPENANRIEPPSVQYYQESPNSLREEGKESEQELETGEMGVEIETNIDQAGDVEETQPSIPASPYQSSAPGDKLPVSLNLGALKLNLPMVLNKVFHMALRKSMIPVDSESKCTPGAATLLKCNVCFCMKENKLLCTNNVC